MDDLLYLECPCTSFPRSFARDFKETYLYPPPSTLYGFLLSLVGEEDMVYPTSQFSKPNFQELLTDVRIALKIDSSNEMASIKLSERVAIALSSPSQILRFGGLSLGESWAMINGIRNYRETDGAIHWLVKDNRGLIGLPIWIDRNTSQGTFQRFSLGEYSDQCLVDIIAPILTTTKAKS